MATKFELSAQLKDTNHKLRRALHECRELLKRAEEAIRSSRQDNDRC
jgi:hypothetical protein